MYCFGTLVTHIKKNGKWCETHWSYSIFPLYFITMDKSINLHIVSYSLRNSNRKYLNITVVITKLLFMGKYMKRFIFLMLKNCLGRQQNIIM